MGECGVRRVTDGGPVRKGGLPLAGKGPDVDEQPPQGNSISTRCRYCGSSERDETLEAAREREHFQVIVTCGCCGHAFAAISRN